MNFVWNPIWLVNTVLCIVILILGIWGTRKHEDHVPIYIGIAFGIFGVSHILNILGLGKPLVTPLIIIRVLAYFTVIISLLKVVARKA